MLMPLLKALTQNLGWDDILVNPTVVPPLSPSHHGAAWEPRPASPEICGD
jgi:hypothetical protein